MDGGYVLTGVVHYHLLVTERLLDPDTGSLDERTVDVASAALDEAMGWAEDVREAMLLGGFEVTPGSGYHALASRWPGYEGSLREERGTFFPPKWHDQIVVSTVVVEIHDCRSDTCELWAEEHSPEFSPAQLPQSQRLLSSRSR